MDDLLDVESTEGGIHFETFYELFEDRIKKLLKDFVEFYYPKGRDIELTFKIKKENFGGIHKEEIDFGPNMKLIYVQEIGTKGLYEK